MAAEEMGELARIARDCTTPGRTQDVARAATQMRRIAAIAQAWLENDAEREGGA